MAFKLSYIFLLNNEITFFDDKKMRIENFPILKRCDHSPKRDEFIDVSLDPPYFSLDSPFKGTVQRNLRWVLSNINKFVSLWAVVASLCFHQEYGRHL
jgi:hypothetical protein